MMKIKKIVKFIVQIWKVVINKYYLIINIINIFYFRI